MNKRKKNKKEENGRHLEKTNQGLKSVYIYIIVKLDHCSYLYPFSDLLLFFFKKKKKKKVTGTVSSHGDYVANQQAKKSTKDMEFIAPKCTKDNTAVRVQHSWQWLFIR